MLLANRYSKECCKLLHNSLHLKNIFVVVDCRRAKLNNHKPGDFSVRPFVYTDYTLFL